MSFSILTSNGALAQGNSGRQTGGGHGYQCVATDGGFGCMGDNYRGAVMPNLAQSKSSAVSLCRMNNDFGRSCQVFYAGNDCRVK